MKELIDELNKQIGQQGLNPKLFKIPVRDYARGVVSFEASRRAVRFSKYAKR